MSHGFEPTSADWSTWELKYEPGYPMHEQTEDMFLDRPCIWGSSLPLWTCQYGIYNKTLAYQWLLTIFHVDGVMELDTFLLFDKLFMCL